MKLSDAYGVVGIRADGPKGLAKALRDDIDLDKLVLTEVAVGPMPSPF
jgi:thiamine pyrophosphate-dependent acetolactate synthase large subunit-like protein